METRQRGCGSSSRRARRVAGSALAAFTLVLFAATTAHAGDAAAGEAHFKKGKDLLAHGEVAAACAELELAEAADPTVGTLGLLAGCHEQLGKLATAHGEYVATMTRARAIGDPRGDFAKQQADRLEPKVPRVKIDGIDPPPAGLVDLDRSTRRSRADRLRAPLQIDPGSHQLEARADGRAPFTTTFDATAGAEAHVTIRFVVAGADASPERPLPARPAAETSAPRAWSRPLGFALVGVAAASLVASGIFGGLAIAKKNASQPCNGASDCKANRDTPYTFAGVSTATFVGGLVAAGAGVVFVISAPRPKTTGFDVRAALAPGAAGCTFEATF